MSLLPYKVTALARVDNGDLNIIPGASVTVLTSGGAYAQIYEANGTTPILNPFNCDDNGERQIYMSGGSYTISVAGGQSWKIRLSGASDIQSVATIADLRALVPTSLGQIVYLLGHTLPPGGSAGGGGGVGAAGGGGVFRAGVTGPTTDNNGTQIVVNSEWIWRRAEYERATPRMFGAIGDGIADDTGALEAAINSEIAGLLPIGDYRITRTIVVPEGFDLIGECKYRSRLIFDFPGTPADGTVNCFEYEAGTPARSGYSIGNLTALYSGTTNRPTRLIYGYTWDNVKVFDIYTDAFRIFAARDCSNVTLENLRRIETPLRLNTGDDEDGGAVASLQGCTKIKGVNLTGVDLAEGIDLGGADDFEFLNCDFTSRAGSIVNDGFDLGFVTNGKLTNCTVRGFGQGYFIKEEGSLGCENVTLTNCDALGFYKEGLTIYSRAGGTFGNEAIIKNIKASDCTFISSETGSRAIRIYNTNSTSGSDNVELHNVTAKSDREALKGSAVTNLKVIGGHYESVTLSGIDVQDSSNGTAVSADVQIIDATVIGGGGATADAAIEMLRVTDPVIRGGSAVGLNTARAILLTNCLRPKVKGVDFSGNRGIFLTWTAANWFAVNGRPAFAVDGNTSTSWTDSAIRLDITGFGSSGAFSGGSIRNNSVEIESSGGSQIGINFGGLTDQYCDWVNVTGNTSICSNPISFASRLGPNSIIENNISLSV